MPSYLRIDDLDTIRTALADWVAHGADVSARANGLLARIEEVEARRPFGTDAAGQRGEERYRAGADGRGSPARMFGLQDLGPWLTDLAVVTLSGVDDYQGTDEASADRIGG
jgi:hypothetical protein